MTSPPAPPPPPHPTDLPLCQESEVAAEADPPRRQPRGRSALITLPGAPTVGNISRFLMEMLSAEYRFSFADRRFCLRKEPVHTHTHTAGAKHQVESVSGISGCVSIHDVGGFIPSRLAPICLPGIAPDSQLSLTRPPPSHAPRRCDERVSAWTAPRNR